TGVDTGLPTLVEYDVGAGRVLAFGQTLEFAWMAGQDAGIILDNAVPYALAFYPFVDVTWLSVDPVSGTTAAGDVQPLAVTVDTTGLAPGTYSASIVIRTNDPLNATVRTDVTLTVTG
ncbi:MAG: hypothetical protein OEM97_09090, partial [Acidimicrobiia bacterium]|nr:hypothetical protein [Acidimicrobiia bacterium]